MLEIWFKSIAARPDIRTAPPFIDFIEFELHTNSNVGQLAPYVEGVCRDSRFHLTDFQFVPSSRSIFASYEEGAGMARLGKAWSLVEEDELGSLNVWSLPDDQGDGADYGPPSSCESNDGRIYFEAHLRTSTHHRCRALYYHEATGRLFVGFDTGRVDVYNQARNEAVSSRMNDSDAIAETIYGLQKEEELNLHSESILTLCGSDSGPGRVMSVGFDKAVRVLNCRTLELLCGGKLKKRLPSGGHLTCGVLEDANSEQEFLNSRMFVGASHGEVFIFSTTVNPPQCLDTIQCDEGDSKAPVTALELAGPNLLVARKYTCSIYRVGKVLEKGPKSKITRIAIYDPQLKFGRWEFEGLMVGMKWLLGVPLYLVDCSTRWSTFESVSMFTHI